MSWLYEKWHYLELRNCWSAHARQQAWQLWMDEKMNQRWVFPPVKKSQNKIYVVHTRTFALYTPTRPLCQKCNYKYAFLFAFCIMVIHILYTHIWLHMYENNGASFLQIWQVWAYYAWNQWRSMLVDTVSCSTFKLLLLTLVLDSSWSAVMLKDVHIPPYLYTNFRRLTQDNLSLLLLFF